MDADQVYGEYLRSTAEPQPAPPIIDPADALGEKSTLGPEPAQDNKPGIVSEFGDFAGTVFKTIGDLPDAAVRGIVKGGAEGAFAAGLIDEDQVTRFRTFMKTASGMAVAEGVEPITASLFEAFGQMAPSALPVFKGLQLAGVARPLAALVAEAVGGAFGFNPDEPNLANLVKDNVDQGELLSVVTELMATDPNDPDAINRIRNGIQDLTIGGIFEGLVWGVPKAVRRFKEGKSPKDVSKAPPGGVPFDPEVSANNLRLHANRLRKTEETGTPYPGGPKNKRMVIPAPEGSNLPDFIVGEITPEDWIARTEKLMAKDEIVEASGWYDRVYGEFLQRTDGDEEGATKLMGAWLAAQQNETPASALANVLFMQEQLARGVPVTEVKGKGLPSANKAALSVLTGEDIKGGIGQKISDFIDAGEGRDARSIMGNDPAGGEPFVVDIHTARDTGLVDQKLINHLTRLGYKVPKKVQIDVGAGGIKGPMYENRAIFGRQLTEHLNSIGWQGRNDWKPREVQAVGWMGLTRMYGDAGAGGDVGSSFARNTRRISMEAAPGEGSPAEIKYGERFGALPGEQQRDVTFQVTQRAIDKVNERVGINLGNVVHATGGWQRFTNPSTVQQAITSRESAEKAANMLGYYLQQSEVWVNTAKGLTKNPKGYAVDLIEVGSTKIRDDKVLSELWDAVLEADASDLIQGYQPIEDAAGNVGIRILVDKGGKKAKAAIEGWRKSFSDISDRFDYNVDVEVSEAEIYKARNNWKEAPDGKGFRDKMDQEGRGPAPDQGGSDIDLDRQELEDFFGSLIEEAERKGGAP